MTVSYWLFAICNWQLAFIKKVAAQNIKFRNTSYD